MNIRRCLAALLVVGLVFGLTSTMPARAATYDVELDDNLDLDDSVRAFIFYPRPESLALADSLNVNRYSPLSESVTFGDSITALKYSPATESIPITDSVSITVYRINRVSLDEPLLLVEQLSPFSLYTLTDTMTLGIDVLSTLFSPTVDALSVSDALSVAVYRFNARTLTEGTLLSESVACEMFTPTTESLPFGDALTVAVFRFNPISLSESLDLDVLTGYNRFSPFPEAFDFEDAMVANKFVPRVDILTLTDSVEVDVDRLQRISSSSMQNRSLQDIISDSGIILSAVHLKSLDNALRLAIVAGTTATGIGGYPLSLIAVSIEREVSYPAGDAFVVSPVYRLAPDGAHFDPPASITLSYDPANLPEGVLEENLFLAYWDEELGSWLTLDSSVDTTANSVTAAISHFTSFSVLGFKHAPPAFDVSFLLITPTESHVGETVSICFLVTNTGGTAGIYQAVLTLNGAFEADETVVLDAGQTRSFTFYVSRAEGTYAVSIANLSGTFTVVPQPVIIGPFPPSPPVADVKPGQKSPTPHGDGFHPTAEIPWTKVFIVSGGCIVAVGLFLLYIRLRRHDLRRPAV